MAVVGAGPAGLAAARAAAEAGARTVVLERAVHPRYKTCGGGLLGWSVAAVADQIAIPVRERVTRATFSRDGRLRFTRRARGPLVSMVMREEFDAALRDGAVACGAVVRERHLVRALTQDADAVRVALADGSALSARVVVGADGSSGVTARHVGVTCDQVDLGLEVELDAPPATMAPWRGRLLLDWGPIPGSYGWVFPKGDRLTVGVIAERGRGEATRAYLDDLVRRLGLEHATVLRRSGHLTRCRTADSPLRHGRVLVAGDAAGLLEPWTREGISYALRSGAAAGRAAAGGSLDSYEREVRNTLVPEMEVGARLYRAFRAHPTLFHAALATPPGWRAFERFCRGEATFRSVTERIPRWIRAAGAAPAG